MLSHEQIEKLIDDHNLHYMDGLKQLCRAIEAAVLPEGWVTMPRIVTPAIEAVYGNDSGAYGTAQELHDAMIAAAVEAECEKVPEGYVLVPKSPNWFFMFLKEWDHFKGMGNSWAAKFYEQLITAAPKPAKAECKCDMRTRILGDGCSVCNPELAAEYASPNEDDDKPAQAEKQEPFPFSADRVAYHKTAAIRVRSNVQLERPAAEGD